MGVKHLQKLDIRSDDGNQIPLEMCIRDRILAKLKADAESYLGEKVTEAVITCLLYTSEKHRTTSRLPCISRMAFTSSNEISCKRKQP